MRQNAGNQWRIKPGIYGVENRPCHWHGEMQFKHFRDIWTDHRNRLAGRNASALQGRGQLAATLVKTAVIKPPRAIDNGCLVGKYMRRTLQKIYW